MAGDDAFDHVNRKLTNLEHCALHRRTVKITCPTCGHARLFDAVALWWLFQRKRWDDRLPTACDRLYCLGCRERTGRIVRPRHEITRERPDTDQPPYPDEAFWKRIVSRYRS